MFLSYMIKTYENFLNKSQKVHKIIITDKHKKTGYIRFNNSVWYKIASVNDKKMDAEKLIGWLQHNCSEEIAKRILINDVCNKCYVNECNKYVMKYNEYMISGENGVEILDVSTFNHIKYKDVCETKFITSDICVSSMNIPNTPINTNIVNEIIESLIIDKKNINNYKHFCKACVVEQQKNNYFIDDSRQMMTIWLRDLLYSMIGCNSVCIIDFGEFSLSKKWMKENINLNARLFVVNYVPDTHIDKTLSELTNLGCNNIMFTTSSDDHVYDDAKFKTYIDNNKYILTQMLTNGYKINWDDLCEVMNYIFCSCGALRINYLRWICE